MELRSPAASTGLKLLILLNHLANAYELSTLAGLAGLGLFLAAKFFFLLFLLTVGFFACLLAVLPFALLASSFILALLTEALDFCQFLATFVLALIFFSTSVLLSLPALGVSGLTLLFLTVTHA